MQREVLLDIFVEKRTSLVDCATRILRDRQCAEDVVHDAVLKVCESDSATEVQAPDSYLFRMVRNMAIDCVRRNTRDHRLRSFGDEPIDVPAPDICPLDRLIHFETLKAIDSALNDISKRTRNAFLQHRLEGVTQKKIAQEIGVSPTLVNFMVRDADIVCRRAAGEELDEVRPKSHC
jgi:RNA polymerase sigma-70 factor (ECF subfamily)